MTRSTRFASSLALALLAFPAAALAQSPGGPQGTDGNPFRYIDLNGRTTVAAPTTASTTHAKIFFDTTKGKLQLSTADAAWADLGGSSTTLAQAYTNGGANGGAFTLTTSGGPVLIAAPLNAFVNGLNVTQANTAQLGLLISGGGISSIATDSTSERFGNGALAVNTGAQNTACGYLALNGNTSGNTNSAFGVGSLAGNTTGVSNAAFGSQSLNNATATGNSAFGYQALAGSTNGINLVACGANAGYAPGGVVGNKNTTGSNNTYLGYQTGANSATQRTNTTTVGYQALSTADNQVSLGNSSVTQILCGAGTAGITAGAISATSILNSPASTLGATTVTTLGMGGTLTVGANTLSLASSTVSGTPTWSSSQAITLSTAAQPSVTSLGTIAGLTMTGTLAMSGTPVISGSPASTLGATTVTTLGTGGNVTLATGNNLVLATSGAGTQIGTGATQLLGFYGATAVAQTSGSTDVLAGLVTQGLRAASSNPPLNLGSGSITGGAISATSITNSPASTLGATTITTSASIGVVASTALTMASPALEADQTWNNTNVSTFEAFVVRAKVTLGSGNLMNLYGGANGQTSEFFVDQSGNVTATGAITATNQVVAGSTSTYQFTGRSRIGSGGDGQIAMSNAAVTGFTTLYLGPKTPTGTDTAGTAPVIAAGPGTGAGTGSTLGFQVSPILASSATVQTLGTVLALAGVQNNLSGTNNLATLSATFADGGTTSSGTERLLYGQFTSNYTAGTKTSAITCLGIDLVETSDPTGALRLIDLRAGASGTTSEFSVTAAGAVSATSAGGQYIVGASGQFVFNGATAFKSPADSQAQLQNNAGNGCQGLVLGPTAPTFPASAPTHGQVMTFGTSEELLTLSTIGLTTDTTANLLPAGAFILAVTARVQTSITTTTNWAVGDATTSARFSAANATLTSGTTSVGITQLGASGAASGLQTAAAKVRITCTGSNPGAGVIRITTHYILFTPATS